MRRTVISVSIETEGLMTKEQYDELNRELDYGDTYTRLHDGIAELVESVNLADLIGVLNVEIA